MSQERWLDRQPIAYATQAKRADPGREAGLYASGMNPKGRDWARGAGCSPQARRRYAGTHEFKIFGKDDVRRIVTVVGSLSGYCRVALFSRCSYSPHQPTDGGTHEHYRTVPARPPVDSQRTGAPDQGISGDASVVTRAIGRHLRAQCPHGPASRQGEPANLDTRRALARAFEFEDIDALSKPFTIPTEDELKAARKSSIERTSH